MSENEVTLGYFLLAVVGGFAILIYFLLKTRSKNLVENLKLSSHQIWNSISDQSVNLVKNHLLFGVWQDASATTTTMVVKDVNDQIAGSIVCPMASRQRTIIIGDKNFLMEFPLTWNRTAILYSPTKDKVIAKYLERGWFRGHEYEVIGYGLIKRKSFSLKGNVNYSINTKSIGVSQFIFSNRTIGKLIVLPLEIPLEARLFILSL